MLLNYFNSLRDNIIIVAFNQISSAAFKVFFEFQGQKDIMEKHNISLEWIENKINMYNKPLELGELKTNE